MSGGEQERTALDLMLQELMPNLDPKVVRRVLLDWPAENGQEDDNGGEQS